MVTTTQTGIEAREMGVGGDGDWREDALLGGRVRLRQAARGYRAGMDAALLAAAVEAAPGQRILDVGCGPGAVLCQVAARRPGVMLTGLERDPAAVALARMNLELNRLGERAEVVAGAIADRPAPTPGAAFDWAVANPPFFDDPGAMRTPDASRAGAWMAEDGLDAWLAYLRRSVREGGHAVIIHRAERLADILAGWGAAMGDMRIRPVHARPNRAATRVLVRATKASKGPVTLLPPLILQTADGAHSAEAERLYRGESALGWTPV
ncbi:tRNA1(Val) (adenine(37)-N6)-methyltransferase [Brevundimonas lutea]|uniref:tRNA1(Val) (adenine(37)-N6)-methyltransferase n=1 Tax=Brevundimonas lutea TaxID=2293980 RepID=UPI0030B82582